MGALDVSCLLAAHAKNLDDVASFWVASVDTSSFFCAIENVCKHREVVPAYFVRSTGHIIVTGVAGSNGGAIIFDQLGNIVMACASKRDALASIMN